MFGYATPSASQSLATINGRNVQHLIMKKKIIKSSRTILEWHHKGISGYRRITIYLRLHKGIVVIHKRVCRLMKQFGLNAVIR
ncbi:transposase [Bacillus sp. C1-1]|nr:transposase [Bacillus sp. C1-1]